MILSLNHCCPACMMQLLTPEIKNHQLALVASEALGDTCSWDGGTHDPDLLSGAKPVLGMDVPGEGTCCVSREC